MKRNFRHGVRFLIVILVIISAFILTIDMASCENRERIIKIGNQGVLSGPYRSFGEDQLVSLQLAISELSPVRIGGFDYSLELISMDDEGNPEKAFLAAQEMVDQGAALVIGSTFDGTTRVSIPVYEEYNIPIISAFAQKAETSLVGDNFFRMIINNGQKIENIADFLMQAGDNKKVILVGSREDYSMELLDYLKGLLENNGMDVQDPYYIDFEEEDMSVVAQNIFIDKPDYVFCALDYNDIPSLVGEVRDAGLEPTFITETMGMSDNIFDVAGDTDLEGLIAIIPEPPSVALYTTDQRASDFWYSYNKELDLLKEEMDLSINGPGEYSPYVYDAIMITIEAMKKSNSTLPQDFVKELKAISYNGLTGLVEFDSNGDRIDPQSTVFVVRDGVWVRYN